MVLAPDLVAFASMLEKHALQQIVLDINQLTKEYSEVDKLAKWAFSIIQILDHLEVYSRTKQIQYKTQAWIQLKYLLKQVVGSEQQLKTLDKDKDNLKAYLEVVNLVKEIHLLGYNHLLQW